MNGVLVPAVVLGAGVVVAIGLPAPQRFLVRRKAARGPVPDLVLALVSAAGLVLVAGPAGAAIGALLAVLGRRAWRTARVARMRQAEAGAAAEAMAVLAAELRAGRPTGVALGNAAQVALGVTAVALAEAGSATGLGIGPGEVLLGHAEASAVPELLRGLAVCWQVCEGAGSSLAAAVERLEEGLRGEQECRDEIDAELAGPRSSALALAALPLVGVLLGTVLGAHPLRVLLHSPLGGVCLVLGVGLDLLGVRWTRRIVSRAGGVL